MSDKIDAAIKATEAEPAKVDMAQHQVIIRSTGRPAVLLLPVDATDSEILEIVGWVGTFVHGYYRNERAKTANGRIIIPRTPLPPQ